MSKSLALTIYQANTPVLTHINAQGELIVYILPNTSKGSIKAVISKILNVPKKAITIKDNNARAEDYERQLDFNIGILKNK